MNQKREMIKQFVSLLGLLLIMGCRPSVGSRPPGPVTPTPFSSPTVVTVVVTAVPLEPTAAPTNTPASTTEAGSEITADADVLSVKAVQTAPERWTFTVEVTHPDTGWEDYADGWDVVLPDGTVSKPDPDSPFTRLLLHPHENEQPFVRSQSDIVIPAEVSAVTVRAHDLVAGFGGREVVVDLTADSGPDFEVER